MRIPLSESPAMTRVSHESGTETHWRVTARRSFVPAYPMSLDGIASAAASR